MRERRRRRRIWIGNERQRLRGIRKRRLKKEPAASREGKKKAKEKKNIKSLFEKERMR